MSDQASFDTDAAYKHEYLHLDNVFGATYRQSNPSVVRKGIKFRRGTVTRPAHAIGRPGTDRDTMPATLWNSEDEPFDPQIGALLEVDDGTRWRLASVNAPVYGRWDCTVSRATQNE